MGPVDQPTLSRSRSESVPPSNRRQETVDVQMLQQFVFPTHDQQNSAKTNVQQQQQLEFAQRTICEQNEQLQHQQQQLALLQQQSQQQQQHIQQQQHMPPQQNMSSTEPNVPLPEKFDGDRRKLRGFLNQLRLIWRLQPNRYPTDGIRVALLGTLLKGPALQWFNPFLEAEDPRLLQLSTTIQLLEGAFGDPDRILTASRRIENLRQGRRSASDYAAEFRLTASDLDWNDSAKTYYFQKGLNNGVKRLLLHKPKPANLEIAINDAIEVDNRLLELLNITRSTYRMHASSNPSPTVNIGINSDAMILDATIPGSQPRAPLTDEERKRRRENHLCLYCGQPGHIAVSCDILASRMSGNAERRG